MSPQPTSRVPIDTDTAEAAVLSHIVALHPIQMTLDELIREMCDDVNDFAERDGVQVAVKHLVGAGLLHRHGAFVVPTRAALRALELAT